jgi:NADH:ubiquinone oxidoreductase subunit 2 (subunit N)
LFIKETDSATTGKKKSKKALKYMYFGTVAPTVIICSVAEMEATTPSTELQACRNIGVSFDYCPIFIYCYF